MAKVDELSHIQIIQCTGAYPRGGHLGHVPPLEPNAQRKNLRRLKDLRGPIHRKSPKSPT